MTSIWRQQVLPFSLILGLMMVATLISDVVLHRLNLVWVGRYLGIPGMLLIIGSLTYSLRKRKFITSGQPKTLLALHEFLAWLGSVMVLVHAGIHFNSILPWLATIAMVINIVSGLVGKILLERSRRQLQAERSTLQSEGMQGVALERAVFWDAVTVDTMARWRRVHIPIFLVFAVLSIGHVFSIFLFWSWR